MSLRLCSGYTKEKIETADWQKAPGITERAKNGTNPMLAERDYTCKCDITGDPIAVVHGVHLWFCYSHHQPYSFCEKAKLIKEAKEFAESVLELDKTERYEYGRGDENKNNKGELPAPGQRWATPKEMANSFIKWLNK